MNYFLVPFNFRRKNTNICPINNGFFRVIEANMFRLRNNFKVINTIICSYAVFVMNHFVSFNFSIQKLFHQISMIKYSFTINIDTQIPFFSKQRSSFFKIIPFWRNFVRTMTVHSLLVCFANKARRFNNIITSFNFTDSHRLYYIMLQMEVQS